MDSLLEHWKLLVGVVLGAFAAGAVGVVYFKEGLKKLILSNGGGIKLTCPLTDLKKTPLSKEEHHEFCGGKWKEHDKASEARWKASREFADKDREFVLSEMKHLKDGQDHVRKTVDKIFDKLDKIPRGGFL